MDSQVKLPLLFMNILANSCSLEGNSFYISPHYNGTIHQKGIMNEFIMPEDIIESFLKSKTPVDLVLCDKLLALHWLSRTGSQRLTNKCVWKTSEFAIMRSLLTDKRLEKSRFLTLGIIKLGYRELPGLRTRHSRYNRNADFPYMIATPPGFTETHPMVISLPVKRHQ